MDRDEALRGALLKTDRVLGKYDPLEHILAVDDFDDGQQGWAPYFPDYDGREDYVGKYEHVESLQTILERTRAGTIDNRVDRKPPLGRRAVPQISSLPTWDVGSAGSFGSYALKIPTLPLAGHKGIAMKRSTCRFHRKFRIETYFTFKADPGDLRLGDTDVRAIYLTFDVHDPARVTESGRTPRRWWPGVRYHNAQDGEPVQRWQAMLRGSKGVKDGPWDYLDDGRQQLGYNRAATKFQWHYLRLTFDLERYEYVDFNCYGKEFNVRGLTHVFDPPLTGWRASTDKAHGLVLPSFCIEADRDKRCFLYLDSVVMSASSE